MIHFTLEDRYELYDLKRAGYSNVEMAIALNKSPSSISRELSRNKGEKGYRPKQAHEKAQERIRIKPTRCSMSADVVAAVKDGLAQNLSPEQISEHGRKKQSKFAGTTTIYRYIHKDKMAGGSLHKSLRGKRKRRKYGSKAKDKRGQIKNRVSIHERPEIVDKKIRVGDWEADLIIGKGHKGALVTLVDRRTRFTKIGYTPSKDATLVAYEIMRLLEGHDVETITFDNGKEFALHELIAEKLKCKTYFADPYSSWQRGVNENTNGLIRWYYPKGTSFANLDIKEIEKVEESLNNRPRRVLKFSTPSEVMAEKCSWRE